MSELPPKPDPDILRHNLQNAMKAVESLRARIKTLEAQLSAVPTPPITGADMEKHVRLLEALRNAPPNQILSIDVTPAPPAWRSVDVAPKHERVLVAVGDEVTIAMQDAEGRWWSRQGDMSFPMCWMPLPLSPEKQKGTAS